MDPFVTLLKRADLPSPEDTSNCTKETCDAALSTYGYVPNLGATVFFLILFILSGLAHAGQGWKKKTWFFCIVMTLGNFGEVLGYVSKLILYDNPFSDLGLEMSMVMLTIAPAFFSAGQYYSLKHICFTFGESFSRLPPAWYTYIFVACDFISIILQGAGGALAASADGGHDPMLHTGDQIMIAGLSIQIITMFAFGILAGDYGFAIYRNRNNLNPATLGLRNSRKFKLFILALIASYTAIMIRCCYRLAELAGGWSPDNEILRDEGLFIGLDSFTCALATIVLNVWHPGWCFPQPGDSQSNGMYAAPKAAESYDEESHRGWEMSMNSRPSTRKSTDEVQYSPPPSRGGR